MVIDRLVFREDIHSRLADSLETALKLSEGLVLVQEVGGGEHIFSERFACPECGYSMEELTPRAFSFNSPYGACPECSGLGERSEFSAGLVIPFPELSINEGAIHPLGGHPGYYRQFLEAAANHFQIGLDSLCRNWKKRERAAPYGSPSVPFRYVNMFGGSEITQAFPGILNCCRAHNSTESEEVRHELAATWRQNLPCLRGLRLKESSLAVLLTA